MLYTGISILKLLSNHTKDTIGFAILGFDNHNGFRALAKVLFCSVGVAPVFDTATYKHMTYYTWMGIS